MAIIENVVIKENITLLLLDVVSLYTSVPTDRAVLLIVKIFSSNDTLLIHTFQRY